MARADITVRGAGIFGLSIAWACVQRGARVQIVDPFGALAGSSGGTVGALSPHVPENWNEKKAFQLESLLMAADFWNEVEAVGGVSADYSRSGRLQPVADEAALTLARGRCETARGLWGDAAVWEVIPAQEVGPWAPVSPSGWLIRDSLSARIAPRRAGAALISALAVRGVAVVPEALDEGAVIWATGWQGLGALSEALGRNMGTGIKGQAVLLKHDAGDVAQIFAGGLHIVPHGDGTVAIGSTSERAFDDPLATDAGCDELVARAVEVMPVLRGAAELERWAGVRARARSRAPMLGDWPERPGHFIANGGFKIGFGMAPGVARGMADLVLDGRDAIPEGFRVEASL